MLKLTVLLAAAVLAFGAAAGPAANPVQQSPVVVRITDTPLFLASPHCPILLIRVKLRAESGRVIGSSDFCFLTDSISGDTETLNEDVTFHLPGGTIEAYVTQVDVLLPSAEVDSFTGTVTSASGRYLGASGTVAGGGLITFDANGVPHPDLTFTITLS